VHGYVVVYRRVEHVSKCLVLVNCSSSMILLGIGMGHRIVVFMHCPYIDCIKILRMHVFLASMMRGWFQKFMEISISIFLSLVYLLMFGNLVLRCVYGHV
jgi:hypothetical protein